jgi:hypothetical protein
MAFEHANRERQRARLRSHNADDGVAIATLNIAEGVKALRRAVVDEKCLCRSVSANHIAEWRKRFRSKRLNAQHV